MDLCVGVPRIKVEECKARETVLKECARVDEGEGAGAACY